MNSRSTRAAAVFFYGLFMDESLLAGKGITPLSATVGYLENYKLRIGERATLLPEPDARAYGVFMTIAERDVEALYSEPSVADYVPETVNVTLTNGAIEQALCYNLPATKLTGKNTPYAESLYVLAENLGFPQSYLDEIREEGGLP